jgi:two-component system chemotaxis sensor kinase CheA
MIAQRSGTLDPAYHSDLLNSMGQLERNARDLQESVMSIRMMPMEYVFSRFPRLVRDLAAKLDKQVQLNLEGSSTELDKSLIERIIDPLTHLVRNSLDHGIEIPENRVAMGKSPVGNLTLRAEHQGGNICIEVIDDGAGLNREKILAKALSQGMPVSDSMTDEEVGMLIFAPGFSTAEQVTDVSGRGVGMDVVKRNIQAMGGHVDILSQADKGTTIRILLPLTLAILDGMSVRVSQDVFILPLNTVMESLQPQEEDIHPLAGGEQVLQVRGEYLPLVELHRLFDVAGAKTDPTEGIVVILQSAGRRYALLVDQLIGQHQVVVKNLESNYRKVPGISAATILGDGSVALIIDVSALQGLNRNKRLSGAA